MLRRFTFWLSVAIVLQLLTGVGHSVGIFIAPRPANETERQLVELLLNYEQDMGAGIHRTMWDLFRALSSCFSLLCLLGALTNIYLLRKQVSADLVRGLVGIQVIVFGICFGVMAVFTFLPPIIATGLVFVSLAATFFTTAATE